MKKRLLAAAALAIITLAVFLTPTFAASSKDDSGTIVLSSANTVVLNGPVNQSSVSEVIEQVQKLNAPPEQGKLHALKASFIVRPPQPIYLFLRTPGGLVTAGLDLVEALKGNPRPVDTITNFAASMGFQLAQQLNTRYILRSGTMMSHHARGGVEGEFGGKSDNQMRSRLSYLERIVQDLDLQTVARTNGKQTLQSYQEAYDHELWISGQDAVNEGYADKVVTARCDQSLDGFESKEVDVMSMFGPITLEYDVPKCPLNYKVKNVRVKGAKPDDNDTKEFYNKIILQFIDSRDNVQNHIEPLRL